MKEVSAKEKQIQDLQANLKSQEEEHLFIKDKLTKMKEQRNEIKNILLVHYHKLLAEGRDTRKEGLIWIIKKIWALGSKVVVSYIPNFLDDKSIQYIFKVSFSITLSVQQKNLN